MLFEGEILIVDDNPDVREALRTCVESWGYRVFEAPNGAIAKIQAQQHRPDLILMDYNMPTANGAQVFEQMQKDPATAGIPVIFVTAASLDEVISSVKLGPRVRFVSKPIEYPKLRGCITGLLAGASKDILNPPPDDSGGEPGIVDLDEP